MSLFDNYLARLHNTFPPAEKRNMTRQIFYVRKKDRSVVAETFASVEVAGFYIR
jgi:hypothetical protein